jgi:hypothetical protein
MNFKRNEVNVLYKHIFWNSIKYKPIINNKKTDKIHFLHILITEDKFPVCKKQKSYKIDSVNNKRDCIKPFFAYSFFNSTEKKDKEFLKTSTAKMISVQTDVTSLFKSPTFLLYLFNCMARNNRTLVLRIARLKLTKLLSKKKRAHRRLRLQCRGKIKRKWEDYRFFSIKKTTSNDKGSQAKLKPSNNSSCFFVFTSF